MTISISLVFSVENSKSATRLDRTFIYSNVHVKLDSDRIG